MWFWRCLSPQRIEAHSIDWACWLSLKDLKKGNCRCSVASGVVTRLTLWAKGGKGNEAIKTGYPALVLEAVS
jgi:hypothetical protein